MDKAKTKLRGVFGGLAGPNTQSMQLFIAAILVPEEMSEFHPKVLYLANRDDELDRAKRNCKWSLDSYIHVSIGFNIVHGT